MTESIRILRSWGTASWHCCGQPAQGKPPLPRCAGYPKAWSTGSETPCGRPQACPLCWTALTTVRYPRARMRRLAMDAALGYTAQTPALPPYLHLLGARQGGSVPARGDGAAAVPLAGAAGTGKRDLRPNGCCPEQSQRPWCAVPDKNRSRWAGYIVEKLSFLTN